MSSDENKIEQSILIPPSINHKWRLWHYDCNDFPQHEKKSCRKKDCKFCHELEILIDQRNGIPPIIESPKRWTEYLKKDILYDSMDAMVSSVIRNIANGGKCSFSALAKQTYFNRKVGFAFFRDPIPFDFNSSENRRGGAFKMPFYSNACDAKLLNKFDNIFCFMLQLLNGLSEDIAGHINGIFLHSKMKFTKYNGDQQNLPLAFALEIWIGNLCHKEEVKRGFINEIETECAKQLDEKKFFGFKNFMRRQRKTINENQN